MCSWTKKHLNRGFIENILMYVREGGRFFIHPGGSVGIWPVFHRNKKKPTENYKTSRDKYPFTVLTSAKLSSNVFTSSLSHLLISQQPLLHVSSLPPSSSFSSSPATLSLLSSVLLSLFPSPLHSSSFYVPEFSHWHPLPFLYPVIPFSSPFVLPRGFVIMQRHALCSLQADSSPLSLSHAYVYIVSIAGSVTSIHRAAPGIWRKRTEEQIQHLWIRAEMRCVWFRSIRE